MKSSPQRGVALIVTLLMLSVITVVAVTFLALSRRERASVAQTGNLTDARYMADAAGARAAAQISVPALATSNILNGDFTVSRNFINPNGFNPAGPPSPFNVSYVYANGQPLSPADFIKNVANLQLDPRAPVFVRTNRPGTPLASEFRFYLDLNRNGQFETNGFFLPYDDAGRPVGTNALFFVGDPEWIGVLEKPNLPHAANNRFLGRYAFIILPVGKTLDLNFIHNQSQPKGSGYFRNQGFGTYEINLAAFLTALNTNVYGAISNYSYGPISTGTAFEDARAFLQYRYGGNYGPNDTVQAIFGPNGLRFTADGIDGLAHDESLPGEDLLIAGWPGASSRRHFHGIHDFFDRSKFPPSPPANFIDRLSAISAGSSSYDRYTLSRLFAQLGTDTAEEREQAEIPKLIRQISAFDSADYLAETPGRINLNYDNVNSIARNFADWNALTFFTNVGKVLLTSQSNSLFVNFGVTNWAMTNIPFGITDIPVSPLNLYTPSVHRLLQVAANIYDATTNDPMPSVFLPIVGTARNLNGTPATNIIGYTTNLNRNTAMQWASTNKYGLPAVVGAKKGLPNFNEFTLQTFFQITRKLEVGRPNTNAPPNQTNQIMLLSVSNSFGLETWNSYSNAFGNSFQVYVSNMFSGVFSNAVDGFTLPVNLPAVNVSTVLSSTNGNWHFNPRTPGRYGYTAGFMVPLYTNLIILTNSRYTGKGFDNATNSFQPRTRELPVADWRLVLTNRLTYIVSTLSARPRVLDVVCLSYQTNLNLTALLMGLNRSFAEPNAIASLWGTNRSPLPATLSTPTDGILKQLAISLGNPNLSPADWKAYNAESNDKASSIASFQAFIGNSSTSNNLFQQAPFTATRRFVHTVTWQANDPLVHYMAEDLGGTTNELRFLKPNETFTNNLNLGRVNPRYQPWLGNPTKENSDSPDPNDTYVGIKDPGVFGSDDWDFPAQKFPSIGWLGRVHRGTPWQTVYLKAEVADPARWFRQSSDYRTHPTNDWRLLDIFTVAQTPNASHGQLSINQNGLAAWTAVLGSLTVFSNTVPNIARTAPSSNNFTTLLINPLANAPVIQAIVDGINRNRLQHPNQVFRSLGEVLSVPELTTRSPFINLNADPVSGYSAQDIQQFGFTDEAYERIPRQILSLLKVGDARYVIYSFGQSLKPADKSIVTGGPHFGICTNYQVTGEVFTRTLMKLEVGRDVRGNAAGLKPAILNFNILPAD